MGRYESVKHKVEQRLKEFYFRKGLGFDFKITDDDYTQLQKMTISFFDNVNTQSGEHMGKTTEELEDRVVYEFITWRVKKALDDIKIERQLHGIKHKG